MAEVNQRPSLRVWLVQAFMEEPAHVAPFPPWEFEAHIVLVTSQERKPLEHWLQKMSKIKSNQIKSNCLKTTPDFWMRKTGKFVLRLACNLFPKGPCFCSASSTASRLCLVWHNSYGAWHGVALSANIFPRLGRDFFLRSLELAWKHNPKRTKRRISNAFTKLSALSPVVWRFESLGPVPRQFGARLPRKWREGLPQQEACVPSETEEPFLKNRQAMTSLFGRKGCLDLLEYSDVLMFWSPLLIRSYTIPTSKNEHCHSKRVLSSWAPDSGLALPRYQASIQQLGLKDPKDRKDSKGTCFAQGCQYQEPSDEAQEVLKCLE